MGKIRRNLAGLIFTALGIIFLYLDMAPTMDHLGHGEHMSNETTAHSVKLLGIGEMTWMWFTMALVSSPNFLYQYFSISLLMFQVLEVAYSDRDAA